MPVRVPPAPSFPGVAHEMGCTTVTTVAELLVDTGSDPGEVALAGLLMVPGASGEVTTTVTVTVLPAAMLPKAQEIVVVPVQLPDGHVAETSVVPAGIVSETVTPVAVCGPRFVTRIA